MTVQEKIEIAEKLIVEAEDRRKHFLAKYKETGKVLYKEMAESETETIEKFRNAIINALL